MRGPWGTLRDDYLDDALALLDGWSRHEHELTRALPLSESQHAALTERVKVAADALQCRPEIRRVDGETRIRLSSPEDAGITDGEVALAARIEDAYRAVTGQSIPGQPGSSEERIR